MTKHYRDGIYNLGILLGQALKQRLPTPMTTIFYSWQSDRPNGSCRNFIERSLQSAIDRLNADAQIAESLRNELEFDKDTKNIPGTPAIFDTIMAKIAAASVFVPDLTFVGARPDGRPAPNPNVLIEYGYALAKLGSARVIAVMNDEYGKPNVNMPFNLAHMRSPITYTLAENADEDKKRAARTKLTKSFENAFRTLFESAEYRAQAQSTRPPSAIEIAALHQQDLDREAAIRSLRFGDGAAKVQKFAGELFEAIKSLCGKVIAEYNFEIACGSSFELSGRAGSCVLKAPAFGVIVNWQQPCVNSLDDAKLQISELSGRLYLPGEFQGGVHTQSPHVLSEVDYQPTVSRGLQLGWVKKMTSNGKESLFLSNDALAEACMSQLLNLLRRSHQNR